MQCTFKSNVRRSAWRSFKNSLIVLNYSNEIRFTPLEQSFHFMVRRNTYLSLSLSAHVHKIARQWRALLVYQFITGLTTWSTPLEIIEALEWYALAKKFYCNISQKPKTFDRRWWAAAGDARLRGRDGGEQTGDTWSCQDGWERRDERASLRAGNSFPDPKGSLRLKWDSTTPIWAACRAPTLRYRTAVAADMQRHILRSQIPTSETAQTS